MADNLFDGSQTRRQQAIAEATDFWHEWGPRRIDFAAIEALADLLLAHHCKGVLMCQAEMERLRVSHLEDLHER